ncbi:hypothetical protein [Arthrobacter sp. 31Y]|uniref:hypothetical protein n=1 Tax=Arthrobacter sp. 31Y TaxID=1115632 RepID=UPI000463BF6A|nr:hypothetical protein [Arthrobacter sp. 31Y]
MDQETIRLIITAAGALLAGWGGAALTSYINRRNTTDTLAASERSSKEQWERTQNREHELWVRDQKQEAYAEFVLKADKAVSDASSMWKGAQRDSSANVSGARMRIRLVGPPELRTVAWEIEDAIKSLIEYSRPDVDAWDVTRVSADKSYEHYALLKARVDALLQDFVAKSRRDLGTAIASDEVAKDVDLDTSESDEVG